MTNEFDEFRRRGRAAQDAVDGATVTVWPRGVRTVVPADVCRCPVMQIGDACPVHQQVLDIGHRMSMPMAPLYLAPDECLVLLQSLAFSVEPEQEIPTDATECSRIVWSCRHATAIQRSLATALAEATYGPRSIAGPVQWLALQRDEPIPDGLPEEVLTVLRKSRTEAGYCDHGRPFGDCCDAREV